MKADSPKPDEKTRYSHIDDGIQSVAALHARAELELTTHQRRVERFTSRLARPRSLYYILVFITLWCTFNMLAPHQFDPSPFFLLQGIVTATALLVAVMVLTTQNRVARRAEQRAHLDLQINLLTEKKIAKLIQLLEELRGDLPMVKKRDDPVAAAMQQSVDPNAVADAIEESIGGMGDDYSAQLSGDKKPGEKKEHEQESKDLKQT